MKLDQAKRTWGGYIWTIWHRDKRQVLKQVWAGSSLEDSECTLLCSVTICCVNYRATQPADKGTRNYIYICSSGTTRKSIREVKALKWRGNFYSECPASQWQLVLPCLIIDRAWNASTSSASALSHGPHSIGIHLPTTDRWLVRRNDKIAGA